MLIFPVYSFCADGGGGRDGRDASAESVGEGFPDAKLEAKFQGFRLDESSSPSSPPSAGIEVCVRESGRLGVG